MDRQLTNPVLIGLIFLNFTYSTQTSDGTSIEAEGKVKDVGTDHAALVVHGSFSWKDEKDGKVYTVTYVADENGFQPVGEHIPSLSKPSKS